MGVDDFTGGVSLLSGDGNGSKCRPGLCHDGGALSGMDFGSADGFGQLVGGGAARFADLGSAAGGRCGFPAFVSGGGGVDDFCQSDPSEVRGVGETGSLDSIAFGGAMEESRGKSVAGTRHAGGGVFGGLVGVFAPGDFSLSSSYAGGLGGECGGGSVGGCGDGFGRRLFGRSAFRFDWSDRDQSAQCPLGASVGWGDGVDGDLAGGPFCRGGSEGLVRAGARGGDDGGGGGGADVRARRWRKVAD